MCDVALRVGLPFAVSKPGAGRETGREQLFEACRCSAVATAASTHNVRRGPARWVTVCGVEAGGGREPGREQLFEACRCGAVAVVPGGRIGSRLQPQFEIITRGDVIERLDLGP